MSSQSKPRLGYTMAGVLNRHDVDIRQLFALVRSRPTPTSIQTPLLGTSSPNPTPVSIYPFTEPGQNYGDVGLSTQSIDLSAQSSGYTKMRLTGNINLAFNNPPLNGLFDIFYLDITQDGVGGRTVGFPVTVAAPPTINTGANARNLIMVYTFDHGTTYTAINLSSAGSTLWSAITIDTNKDMLGFGLDNLGYITFKVTSGTPQKIDNSVDGKVLNFLTNGNARLNLSEDASLHGTLELFGAGGGVGTQASASFKAVSSQAGLAGLYIGDFVFDGKNSAGTQTTFADIIATSRVVTAGNEAGEILFNVKRAGALANRLTLNDNGLANAGTFSCIGSASFLGLLGAYAGLQLVSRIVSSGTSSVADDDVTIVTTNTAGIVTLNLPSASTHPGQVYIFYKRNSGGTTVINRAGADLIDGATSYTLSTQFETVTIQSDAGSKWMILSSG